MSALGQAKYDESKPRLSGPKAKPLGNPMMKRDPNGFPPHPVLRGAVPVENTQIPGRFVQFFD